jgi:hypothetical protein
VIWAALAMIAVVVLAAIWMWYALRQYLAGISVARQRRLMRWTTAASVGIGVVILVGGLVASVLTGYWLILLPTWSFGLLHITLAVQSWLRWARRSGTSP